MFDPMRQADAAKWSATRGSRCGVAPRGGNNKGRGDDWPEWGGCGGVAQESSDLAALCPANRGCGDRPATCFKQRDIIPDNDSIPACDRAQLGVACSLPLDNESAACTPNKKPVSRQRRPCVRRSVVSVWIGGRTSAKPQNAHRLNKGPDSHRLTIVFSGELP